MGPSVKRVLINCSNGSAPLNKMGAMHIYNVKTLKNLFLQNQESFEAYYIASGTQGLEPILFK